MGLLCLVVGVLVVAPLALMPVLFVAVIVQGGTGSVVDRVGSALQSDPVTPASMLYLNLTLASMVVISLLIVRLVHGLPPRWLTSVRPGMRWRLFFVCVALGAVAILASQAMLLLLPAPSTAAVGSPALPTGQLLAIGIVILLTTPLQAVGEEYGFRGYLVQAFGSLFASRVAALMASSVLFALAHGVQNPPLFLDRLAFGLMAGVAVLVVGGLEAGIALHILNNLVAFGIAVAYDQVGAALTVSEVSWWQLPQTVVQNGVFLILLLYVSRRMGIDNVPAAVEPLAGSNSGLARRPPSGGRFRTVGAGSPGA